MTQSPEIKPVDPGLERKRIQRSRSIVMALLLVAFVVLVFAISIAKMN